MEIVFSADFHANFLGGMAAAAALARARRCGALVFDTGDFLGEGFLAGRIASDRLEAVQNALFDALCPGNHGFDQAMRSPRVLCCNLRSSDHLQCVPWRVMEHEGLRIGVTGLIGDAAFTATPLPERRGWYVKDTHAALTAACREMRAKSVDHIILLSHCGLDEDIALARTAPDVTAILSGHCHSAGMAHRVGEVLIAKAPELGVGIGRLTLDAGGVRDLGFTFSKRDQGGEQDPIFAPIATDLARVAREAQEVLGRQTLRRLRLYDNREAQLANLVSAISEMHCGKRVLINRNVFRALPVGPELTRLALYDFVPFNNLLVELPAPAAHQRAHAPEQVFEAGPAWWADRSSYLTTDYMAETVLGLNPQSFRPVGQLRRILAEILTNWDHQGHRSD
jgi:2',3'-cyclic-nucleotide 2'-phosphodiesterase (5'-nucleotidase family)